MNPVYLEDVYRRNRAELLRQHRAEFGDWCPGAVDLAHAPHPETDLTTDHMIPVREGGTSDRGNLRVLCRSANSGRRG